jgi:phage shock protein C
MESTQQDRRLYRSRSHRMLAGVCGGLAEYFSIDVTVVRLVWAILTLFGGWGILVYVAAVLIMPLPPETAQAEAATPPPAPQREPSSAFWGILLIVVGCLWVSANLGFHIFVPWWGFPWRGGIGVLLIIAGVVYLVTRGTSPVGVQSEAAATSQQGSGASSGSYTGRLMRSHSANIIFGVCGGIAEYLRIDPVLVRLVVVVAAFGSFGLMVLLYLLFAGVLPLDDATPRSAPA